MGYEYKFDIAGVEYSMNDVKSANIEHPLFDKLSVGNACYAELSISLWPKSEIPRMAEIRPYCRENGSENEWYLLGVFYIDTRTEEQDLLEIVACDCIAKSEAIWKPRDGLMFPMTMSDAAILIAAEIGTTLDPRCSFNDTYIVAYPTEDEAYTMREILQYIAAAHAGNWIVTNEGKLLLIPLFANLPPETHYLVTQDGRAITLGGVKLLV